MPKENDFLIDSGVIESINVKEHDWIADFGCSHPMTLIKSNFVTYTPLTSIIPVLTANGYQMTAIAIGSVLHEAEMPDGSFTSTTINDILHVPELSIDLLSIRMLANKGACIFFKNDDCNIYAADGKQCIHAIERNGQYEVQLLCPKAMVSAMALQHASRYNEATIQLWHRRTGHLGIDDLKRL